MEFKVVVNPLKPHSSFNKYASPIVAFLLITTGLLINPLLNFLTLLTSFTYFSIVLLL